ncbi:DUF2924 domain-containing protein [Sphingomonas sp. A2-49]|uniref:DUF2924 domain-containing protein n=1 Tax=Sphingomonas sp. A2-49 TaxID=1391375 RepID=UPI0021D02188|nr:DUF2924 domain-containing protein [Sphingomonas sp. A2-49]MCU6455265.1 DUF2924 domain-containing protein [Sphingomonas sp. A2-49]
MALADDIAQLDTLPIADLRARWRRLIGAPAPKVGTNVLRLALAWEIQARVNGGLARSTTQALDQLARGRTRTDTARAGMRLVREWQGAVHVVEVGEDAVIRWDGRDWRSLSEVARAITGTRWSGPAFFGLKKAAAA